LRKYESANKLQSIEWKNTSSRRVKKYKGVPSASKLMLTLFQDFNGSIIEHYQCRGQTVNSARYFAVLEVEKKPAILYSQ
jgi:hypothetical protein